MEKLIMQLEKATNKAGKYIEVPFDLKDCPEEIKAKYMPLTTV